MVPDSFAPRPGTACAQLYGLEPAADRLTLGHDWVSWQRRSAQTVPQSAPTCHIRFDGIPCPVAPDRVPGDLACRLQALRSRPWHKCMRHDLFGRCM